MEDLELDVRPILASGGDPFGAIMAAVAQLAPAQSLKLIASFRPEPLFKLMTEKGFTAIPSPLDNGDWQVVFMPQAISDPANPETWPDPVDYLDCSALDTAGTQQAVQSALTLRAEGEVLFALFSGEPLSLYPDLRIAGHAWVGDFDADGEAYRLMIRAGRV